jgi:hypothetical protein
MWGILEMGVEEAIERVRLEVPGVKETMEGMRLVLIPFYLFWMTPTNQLNLWRTISSSKPSLIVHATCLVSGYGTTWTFILWGSSFQWAPA